MKILGAILPDGEDSAGKGGEDEAGRGSEGEEGLRFETKSEMVKRRIRSKEAKMTLSAFLEAIVFAIEQLPSHNWGDETTAHTRNEDIRSCETGL